MEAKNFDLNTLKINRSEEKQPFYRNKKAIIAIMAILVVIIILFLLINPFTSTIEVKGTSVTKISHSQTSAILTANGYVVAQRKAAVASKGMGRLVFLGVVEGDEVKKDQIIARLEDIDIKAQLEQAEANLKLNQADLKEAENNYQRQKNLFAVGSTTKSDLDASEARLLRVQAGIDVAKAMVKNAEVSLENTLIRAPFNGKVLSKNADVGEVVAPLAGSIGSRGAVVTIADMTSLEVEVDVSESNLQKVIINQECEISLDAYPNVKYPGFVSKIVPTADRSKATVQVKIGFRKYDEKVLPEMSAKVIFLSTQQNTKTETEQPMLVIPTSAVFSKQNKNYVYKIESNVAVVKEVTTGRVSGSYTEVLSGLNEGDIVIETVTNKISDGSKLKVL